MTTSMTHRPPVVGRPFAGFRLRRAGKPVAPVLAAPTPARDPDALARLLARFPDLGPRFWSMSEDAFGDWLDALPLDEFLEWVGLGAEGIGKALKPYVPASPTEGAVEAAAEDAKAGAPDAGDGQECLPFADTTKRAPDRRRPPRGRQGAVAHAAAADETAF
ncbi:hypothetical protein [Cupriavidus sp. TMH.W2]|uniref:hypothetical protein n=1 Tax=Cupriavidus sp. TMH.W2 TaxID=3434465 RepID=UPI003D783802